MEHLSCALLGVNENGPTRQRAATPSVGSRALPPTRRASTIFVFDPSFLVSALLEPDSCATEMGQSMVRLNARGPVEMILGPVQISQEEIASTNAIMGG